MKPNLKSYFTLVSPTSREGSSCYLNNKCHSVVNGSPKVRKNCVDLITTGLTRNLGEAKLMRSASPTNGSRFLHGYRETNGVAVSAQSGKDPHQVLA